MVKGDSLHGCALPNQSAGAITRFSISYPELVAQYGQAATLPQSFPLCAEIVSPTDLAENVLLKSQQYLESGGKEIWLVFPESCWVMVVTQNQGLMFASSEVAITPNLLAGFAFQSMNYWLEQNYGFQCVAARIPRTRSW